MQVWARAGWMAGVLCGASMMLGVPAASGAAPDPAAVAKSLVENYVLPRHRELAAATASFEAAAREFCAAPDEARLAALDAAFNGSADAWLAIESLQFGPIELLMRSPRMYFWPDPTGRAAQDVAEFVATGDPAQLGPEAFTGVTVSLQGLPAAEVALFDDDGRRQLLAGDEAGKRRCALLIAIAGNIAGIAADLEAGWISGDEPFVQVIATPGPGNSDFANQDEVTVAFLKAINHALRFAGDTRLKPVLGADIGAARPDRAEAWRSGRSLRNIVVELETAQALYLGTDDLGLRSLAEASAKDPGIAQLLVKAFRITVETARSIGAPLPKAVVDPSKRPQLQKLATQIQALRQLVGTRLAAALELSVGFNALDGD